MKQTIIDALSRFGMVVLIVLMIVFCVTPLYACSVEQAETEALVESSREVELSQDDLETSEVVAVVTEIPPIVYDDMTMDELAEKLNRSLHSAVSNQGYLFASYSLEQGVDPYLAVAIMLHETGCKWKCSALVTQCNNVGGIRGNASCGSSGYMRFSSLEDGIKRYIDNLKNNYIAYGLTTPSQIQAKYVGSTNSEWTERVNMYLNEIKTN